MTRRVLPWLLLAVTSACTPPTEILVLVRSELSVSLMGGAHLVVEHEDGTPLYAQDCVDLSRLGGWPGTSMSLGLLPDGDALAPFRVRAEGFIQCGAPTPIVVDSARVEFVRGQRLALELELAAACVGIACDPDQTCDPTSGACVSDARSDLPGVPQMQPDLADVTDASVQPDGAAPLVTEAPLVVAAAGADATRPVLAPSLTGFHVAFLSNTTSTYSIEYGSVSSGGAPVGSSVVLGSTPTPTAPALSTYFNGSMVQDMVVFEISGSLRYRFVGSGAPDPVTHTLSSPAPYAAAFDGYVHQHMLTSYAGGRMQVVAIDPSSGATTVKSNENPGAAPQAIAAAPGSNGSANVWIVSNRIGGEIYLMSTTNTPTAEPALAPFAATATTTGYLSVGQDPASGVLVVVGYTAGGAPNGAKKTLIPSPMHLAVAADGSGGALCVLEVMEGIALAAIDSTGTMKYPTLVVGNDGYTRSNPTIAYGGGHYVVAYERKPSSGGLSEIYGFLY